MAQTFVKVVDISTDEQGRPTELNGTERTITYKAYLFKVADYKLIGQCDENGNLIPGNPNLDPQHRQTLQQPALVAAPVVSNGDQQAEIERLKAELAKLQNQAVPQAPVINPEVKERKKPGPKPKEKEVVEVVA